MGIVIIPTLQCLWKGLPVKLLGRCLALLTFSVNGNINYDAGTFFPLPILDLHVLLRLP